MKLINRIKLNNQFVSIFVVLITMYSCENSETQTVTTLNNLVWADEFDTDGALDTTKWDYNIGTGENGWGNNELQYYTDRLENVQVKDGVLHITAIQENYMGSGYTSGRILTKGILDQKYGRFEARIKSPWGKGLWSAFWMLGSNIDTVSWPSTGEIDIMEYLGDSPTEIFGTLHGPGYSGGEGVTKQYALEGDRFDTNFHVFGVEWGENYINFYVDDVLYNQLTPNDVTGEWVFNKSFFMILNLAVGGNLPGSPNADTVFPQTMMVDYVRVYQ